MGSLCWARWEVARLIIKGNSMVEVVAAQQEAEAAASEVIAKLPTVEVELDSVAERLPSEVRNFANRLREDVEAAQSEAPAASDAGERLAQLEVRFDFESYPNLEAYGALAARHPNCRRP